MNLHIKKNGKSNKGFYIALGICLIAVGVAAWTTYDSVVNYAAPQDNSLSSAAKTNNTVSGVFVTESAPASSAQVSSAKPASSKPVSSAPSKAPAKQTAANAMTFAYPVEGNVLQKFSKTPVFSKTLGDYRAHTGVDLSAKQDEAVKSAAEGTVTKVYKDDQFGNTVIISHGSVEAWYCGLNKMSVKEKETVTQGQEIGTVGVDPIENDKGPHLHLIMKKDGQFIDPLTILK
ncbi:MAG TPA: M23 family metallopeptidase [Caproicibacter sp.]|nr:M23 family metallopeptidase [Caproicibacter sp.]